MNNRKKDKKLKYQKVKASLTLEAALVFPIFLFCMLAFLSFIQIFTIQEELQAAITKMGLTLAKASYIYEDFISAEEAEDFDQSIFDNEFDIGLHDFASSVRDGVILKFYVKNYLDVEKMNRSCIQNGVDGIDFSQSKILDTDDCVDIIASYYVVTPFRFFGIPDMHMLQRVKLRCWTGLQVAAKYSTVEEDNAKDPIVYITETGSVYHTNRSCIHINITVNSVYGIPSELRNDNGGKYFPCENCCKGKTDENATYYITSDGTRYHSDRNCSSIKRNVKEVHLSDVADRRICKRCSAK